MLTVTDLFAGAGGSSTGAVSVPGVEIRVASNHWQRAIDVHNANHPDALHVCADITQIDPRRFPRTDLLWASPECTNHSLAKGRKMLGRQPDLFDETLPDEAAERSRATMWDVVRFTEAHRYQAVVVENVVEAAKWLPFQAWLMAMDSLGYDHQVVYINSMHAQATGLPAPQSRDRMYVVFWRKGNTRPDLESIQRPAAYCPRCERVVESQQAWKKPGRPWGRYRAQYVYACGTCRGVVVPGWLPAASIIDWSVPSQRIGDRAKPLAAKTRARIAAGIARYWRPFHLENAGSVYDSTDPRHPKHGDPNAYIRAWPVESEPLRTIPTWGDSKALAVPPFVMDTTRSYDGHQSKRQWPADLPLPTQTTQHAYALLHAPFIAELRGKSSHRSADEALSCITTMGAHHALVHPPFVAELRGGGSDARAASDPLATVVASGNHHALVASYYGNGSAIPSDRALPTVTAAERHALIVRHYSQDGDPAHLSRPAMEAFRTLTSNNVPSLLTPGDLEAAEAQVDDAYFRMFEPHEIAAGMAFPHDYLWDGTRREKVRMAGGAVTPPNARDLIWAVVQSLGGEARAA